MNAVMKTSVTSPPIAWVYESAAHLGIDPNQLYIGGQSSDGHLAAVALTTDWPRDFGLPWDWR